MKRILIIGFSFLAACQSTKPARVKKDLIHAFNEDSWSDGELRWVNRAAALHEFMVDYYQNPRTFRASSFLGLSEMQKIIVRNRSEAWQPHLADRNLRISWVVDTNAGVSPYHWVFAKDWKTLLQERVLSCRRSAAGMSGVTLWILPTADFKEKLSSDDHAWLKSLGIVATDPDGDFETESGAVQRKVQVDENGVFMEAVLEGDIRVKSRIAIVLNDVEPVYVDSSHRFLSRELAVLRGSMTLQSLDSKSDADPIFREELRRNLLAEKTGQHEAIEWLDKHILQPSKNSAKSYGFPGLWEAYLKGFVQVSNVPGLEYQNDPAFLAHLDEFGRLYLGKSYSAPRKDRSPGSLAAPPDSRRVLSLEYDGGGPVLGLF